MHKNGRNSPYSKTDRNNRQCHEYLSSRWTLTYIFSSQFACTPSVRLSAPHLYGTPWAPLARLFSHTLHRLSADQRRARLKHTRAANTKQIPAAQTRQLAAHALHRTCSHSLLTHTHTHTMGCSLPACTIWIAVPVFFSLSLHGTNKNRFLLICYLPFCFHCSPGNKPRSLSLSLSFIQSSLTLLILPSASRQGFPPPSSCQLSFGCNCFCHTSHVNSRHEQTAFFQVLSTCPLSIALCPLPPSAPATSLFNSFFLSLPSALICVTTTLHFLLLFYSLF